MSLGKSGMNKMIKKLEMCNSEIQEAPKEISDLLSSDHTQSEQPPSEFSQRDEPIADSSSEESDNSGNILDEECNETIQEVNV